MNPSNNASIPALPRTFDELNALRPLHLIKDDHDYRRALQVIDQLLAKDDRSQDQVAYLHTLAVLLAAYEEVHDPLRRLAPVEVLRHLCKRSSMSASALGELLGNRSLGSKLLRGERELSKSHIRVISRHFRVSAGLFL